MEVAEDWVAGQVVELVVPVELAARAAVLEVGAAVVQVQDQAVARAAEVKGRAEPVAAPVWEVALAPGERVVEWVRALELEPEVVREAASVSERAEEEAAARVVWEEPVQVERAAPVQDRAAEPEAEAEPARAAEPVEPAAVDRAWAAERVPVELAGLDLAWAVGRVAERVEPAVLDRAWVAAQAVPVAGAEQGRVVRAPVVEAARERAAAQAASVREAG